MALSLFSSAYVKDMVLRDFRRDHQVLRLVMDSPASRMVQEKLKAGGTPGGYAQAASFGMIESQNYTPVSGVETIASWPSGTIEPTLSYANATDTGITFALDKFAYSTRKVNDIDRYVSDIGAFLESENYAAMQQELGDDIEETMLADMVAHGQFESVSGGTGTNFVLDTSSEANLRAGLAIAQGACNKANWPKDDRWLILPGVHEGISVKYANLTSPSLSVNPAGSQTDGTLYRIGGFNVLYSNSFAVTTSAVIVSLQKSALVMPAGFFAETLRDIDTFADYMRMFAHYGVGSIGASVLAYDDGTPVPNDQKEGLLAITVV
jgi:hypothetical protein